MHHILCTYYETTIIHEQGHYDVRLQSRQGYYRARVNLNLTPYPNYSTQAYDYSQHDDEGQPHPCTITK